MTAVSEESPRRETPGVPSAARFAVSLLFLVNGALFATWVSRIPAIQAEHGLSHGALGLALLGLAFGALVSMPVAGWLSYRYGSARVCAVSALIYAAGLPCVAMAPSVAWLCAILFVFGTSHGALDVAMNAQAVEVEARYVPKPIMSAFHALFSLGGLLGALAGGFIAAAGFPPIQHFIVVAIAGGSAALFIANPRLLPAAEHHARKEAESATTKTRGRRLPPILYLLGILAFCVMLGEGAMADWTGIYLRQITGSSEGVAAAGYAAFSIAMAAGRFLGDRLSSRFGGAALVRSGGLLSAFGLAAALVWPHPVMAMISFAMVGAGFATIVPQVFTAAARVEGVASGPAVAVVSTIGYFGFLMGPPLIGFAAEAIGLRGALGLVVAASAVLALLARRVEPVRKRTEPSNTADTALARWTPEEVS